MNTKGETPVHEQFQGTMGMECQQTSMAVRRAEDPVKRFQHFQGIQRQSHEEAKGIASTVKRGIQLL